MGRGRETEPQEQAGKQGREQFTRARQKGRRGTILGDSRLFGVPPLFFSSHSPHHMSSPRSSFLETCAVIDDTLRTMHDTNWDEDCDVDVLTSAAVASVDELTAILPRIRRKPHRFASEAAPLVIRAVHVVGAPAVCKAATGFAEAYAEVARAAGSNVEAPTFAARVLAATRGEAYLDDDGVGRQLADVVADVALGDIVSTSKARHDGSEEDEEEDEEEEDEVARVGVALAACFTDVKARVQHLCECASILVDAARPMMPLSRTLMMRGISLCRTVADAEDATDHPEFLLDGPVRALVQALPVCARAGDVATASELHSALVQCTSIWPEGLPRLRVLVSLVPMAFEAATALVALARRELARAWDEQPSGDAPDDDAAGIARKLLELSLPSSHMLLGGSSSSSEVAGTCDMELWATAINILRFVWVRERSAATNRLGLRMEAAKEWILEIRRRISLECGGEVPINDVTYFSVEDALMRIEEEYKVSQNL